MSPDDQPEQRKSDATIDRQKRLDSNLAALYPPLTADTLDSFRNREYPEVTINLGSTKLARTGLTVALDAASNPNDPAHARHASEGHPAVYADACQMAKNAVTNGTEVIYAQQHMAEIQGEYRKFERWVIESPSQIRETSVPSPQISAEDIYQTTHTLKDKDIKAYEKNTRKRLRDVAVEKGMAHAITAAIYLNYSNDQIAEIFAEPNFQSKMVQKYEEYGVKAKFPTTNRIQDKNMLHAMREQLVIRTDDGIHPNYSPVAFENAFQLLAENDWILTEDDWDALTFQQTTRTVHAKVVFNGMTEIAQRTADPGFRDPARSDYIDDHYSGKISSYVLTAYLVHEKALWL